MSRTPVSRPNPTRGGARVSAPAAPRPAARAAATVGIVGVLLLSGCQAEADRPLSRPVMGSVGNTVLVAEAQHGLVHIDESGHATSVAALEGAGGPLVTVGAGYARPRGAAVEFLDADVRPTHSVAVPGVVKVVELQPQADGSLLVKSTAPEDLQQRQLPVVWGRIVGDRYEHLTVAGRDASVTVCPDGRTHLLEVGPGADVAVGADGWPSESATAAAAAGTQPVRVRVLGPVGATSVAVAPTSLRLVGGEFDCTTGEWAGFVYEGDAYYRLLTATLAGAGEEKAAADGGLVVGGVCTDSFSALADVQQPRDSGMRFFRNDSGGVSVCDARTGTVAPTAADCGEGRVVTASVAGDWMALSCIDNRHTTVREYRLGTAGEAAAVGAVKVRDLGQAVERGGWKGLLDNLELRGLMPAAR